MSKRLLSATLGVLLVWAIAADGAFGKAWYSPDRSTTTQPDKVAQYAVPQSQSQLTARQSPRAVIPGETDATRPATTTSLGRADVGAVASTGYTLYNTYNDDQYRPPVGRMIDFRATPDVHFVYGEVSGPTGNTGFGYNVYDPINGDWPRGSGVGCRVQQTDEIGQWAMMDVDPRGFVVMGGEDNTGGAEENHFYFQSSLHSCFFGGGSVIDASQYNDGHFLNAAESHLSHPKLEIQEWAGDTVLHVIAGESDPDWASSPYHSDFTFGVVSYYRRVGTGVSATWAGPTVIDTIAIGFNGTMAASRVSPEVAVSYCKFHDQAFPNNQAYDTEVWMRTSDSVGIAWNAPVNVTTYSRVEASQIAWFETGTLYDSDGYLHLVWTGFPTVENVYDDVTFFWGDYSCSIFHWTDRITGTKAGGTIVKVHDADWGQDLNTQVCGFGGPGTGYLAQFTLSECNNRLYCFFSQFLDANGNWDTGPQIDDCASGGFSDRGNAANGEIGMCVSSSLDGILWDAARNLSNSYTAGCDSAGFGGLCMDDYKLSAARYGMDVASFDTSGVPVTLTWPGTELVDPTPAGDPAYAGDHFLHVMYLEDHFPSPGWRDAETFGQLTNNDLKWMRVACVDPVQAPQIATSEDSLGYPDYTTHGETDTVTVTVTNDGNVTLTVDSIVTTEDVSGPSGWLGISQSAFSVNAGVNNTATFDMYVNDGPVVDNPGTIVALNGNVVLWSNAANVDSALIKIVNYLVADTVIGLELDTINTFTTARAPEPGEFVSLVVTNTGEMGYGGNGGNGGLNLDYVANGGDCNDAATSYLFSGGPMIIRADVDGSDTDFVFSQAMFQNVFSTDESFKRIPEGELSGPIVDAAFDGFFTGTNVNRDSSIVMERTYYAPLGGGDSSDFVVMETRFFAADGSPQSPLVIGEAMDWDVPGDDGGGSTNLSGLLEDQQVVYQVGVDDETVELCQTNTTRYATTKLLGYFLNSALGDNPCVGACTPYGAYVGRNDSLFAIDDSLLPRYYWETMADNSGLNPEPSNEETDLHMVITYAHDYTLPANDTFTVYTAYTTVHNGDELQLSGNLDAAFEWYRDHLRSGCEQLCGCCEGLTGNVDGDPGGLTDIGDLTALIAYLYIPPNPVPECPEEANIDGDVAGLIDIGDLTALIAYLYIPPNPEPAACQ